MRGTMHFQQGSEHRSLRNGNPTMTFLDTRAGRAICAAQKQGGGGG